MVWLGGILSAACLLVTVYFLRESDLPVYLQDAAPMVHVWEIVPGDGIGPMHLGPLSHDAVRLLRKSAVIVQHGLTVTCLLRHADRWTAVVARTGEPAPDDHAPDPLGFESIERVMTTSRAHPTPEGVRVGSALPDIAAALDAPEEVCELGAPIRRVLRWHRGLEACMHANRIAWFGVVAHAGAETTG